MQVAGLKIQSVNPVRGVVEHPLHRVEVLATAANIRHVFEAAAGLAVLYCKRYREVVGVEVPRKAVALFGDVDNDVRERVGVAVEGGLLESALDEGIESRVIVNSPQRAGGGKVVGGDKGVRAREETPHRVFGWQRGVVFAEVRIGVSETAVALVGDAVCLGHQFGYAEWGQEARQHRAAARVECFAGFTQHLLIPR